MVAETAKKVQIPQDGLSHPVPVGIKEQLAIEGFDPETMNVLT